MTISLTVVYPKCPRQLVRAPWCPLPHIDSEEVMRHTRSSCFDDAYTVLAEVEGVLLCYYCGGGGWDDAIVGR